MAKVNARLTTLVSFSRVKKDAYRDEAGQVNEFMPQNWEPTCEARGDVQQLSSTEGYAQNQQQPLNAWSVLCRGSDRVKSVTQRDRMAFKSHGRLVTVNIDSVVTVQDVPYYIEFKGTESNDRYPV